MKKYINYLFMLLLVSSCIEDTDHKTIDTTVLNPNLDNKTILSFKELLEMDSHVIGSDTLVTGYVVSTDDNGNFYKELYIQNTLGIDDLSIINPRMGLRVRLGVSGLGLKFTIGRKVAINLQGLKKIKTDGVLTIGSPNQNYIKDILEFDIDKHVFKYDEVGSVLPKVTSIKELDDEDLNTIVKIVNVHFKEIDFNKPLANLATDNYNGNRTLEYCNYYRTDTIVLETSNFSRFSQKSIPQNQLSVQAIYTKNFNGDPILVLNDSMGLESLGEYEKCYVNIPNVLITEVADPKEEVKARFVELYNKEAVELNLEGWSLVRYNFTLNNNTKEKAALVISLSDLTIKPNDYLIISRDKVSFESYFNVLSDFSSSKLDGNGDDAYELIDNLGNVVDVFGDTEVDGTDANWEYTDGVAKRNLDANSSSVFDIVDWQVITESTVVDYSPKKR